MNRFLLAFVLVFLVAAGLILFLRPRMDSSAGQGVLTPAPQESSIDLPPDETLDSSAEETREDLTADPGIPNPTPQAIGLSSHPEAGILVRVVMADGGDPCPGATVFAQEYMGLAWEKLCGEVATGMDRSIAFSQYAQTYLSNEAGEAVVPVPRTELFLRGEWDGRSGETFIGNPRPGETITIRLEKRLNLTVMVCTSDGEPAPDVHVALRGERERGSKNLGVAVSDANGRAVIADVLSLLASFDEPFLRATIRLPLPLSEPVEAQFDLAALPDEPVLLTLPPTGSVVVHLVDEREEPVSAQLPVHLARDDYPEYPPVQNWERSNPLRNLHGINRFSREGIVRFPYVGLDLNLAAYAPVNGSQELDAVKAEGPKVPGQEIQLVVRPASGRRLLAGRLVLPSGDPPPPGKMVGLFLCGSSTVFGNWFREGPQTDGEGRFRIVIGEDFVLPATLVLLHPGEGDGRPWQTVLGIPADLPEGVSHLGEFLLERAPLLVAGNVLRSDGRPIPGAKVRVYAKPVVMEPKGASRKPVAALDSFTDHLGAFRVFGRLPGASESFLFVTSEEGPPVSQQFTPGEDGVEVWLASTAGLSGWVLLAPSMQPELLELNWLQKKGNRVAKEALLIDEEGRFAHHGLPAGPGRLVVSFKNDPDLSSLGIDPIWKLDLELPPGVELKDPRLEGIDLRHLRVSRVKVQDPNGNPIRRAIAVGADHGVPTQSDGGGTILLPSWRNKDSWSVEARGFRAAVLPQPVADQVITLEPAILVDLRLDRSPIPSGFSIRVNASGPGVTPFGLGSRATFSAETQAAQLFFQEGGTHQLEVFLLGPPGTAPLRFLPNSGVSPTTLFVQMAAGDQVCTVTIPPAALEAAVLAIEE
ncbi:MAG: hypothetical protein ISR76_04955 [Planctomycetes bacterium]|nr:hypothetical protein [Planctomycetota bacterium]